MTTPTENELQRALEDVETLLSGKATKAVRRRQRKVRRDTVNVKKRELLNQNENIVAWKLAARQLNYFSLGSFKQLPHKNTPEWQKIHDLQAKIMRRFWKQACRKLEKRVDATGSGDDFDAVKTYQRKIMSEKIRDVELAQQKKKKDSWTTAMSEYDGADTILADIPKRNTKAFREKLKDEQWNDAYKSVIKRQKELLIA